jgi:uncharacterized protein YlxW (UPF0749 family)
MTKKPEEASIGFVSRPVLIIDDEPRWADEYARELQREILMLREEVEELQSRAKHLQDSREYWRNIANSLRVGELLKDKP